MAPDAAPFLRHLESCNTARLPGGRTPFRLGDAPAGWVDPDLVPELERRGLPRRDGAITLADPARLEPLGEDLAASGVYRSHHELFDVAATADGPAIARVDRGALPLFGLIAHGVHMNGLVRRPDGLHLWIGRRATDKRLDPGKLDHLVAGGIPAGHTPEDALHKEAAEEASIPLPIVRQAVPVARIRYAMDRPEGLRRDVLHCYDLELPADFVPAPADGEVESFALIPVGEAFRIVRDTDDFKFNVNLVLIDLFLRLGLIDPDSPAGRALRAGLAGTATTAFA
ncbi:NUDIX domain-containing protein [Gluconacetobacter azotocaptans]|uniref:NUDIX domain-containing protein n=1 Tax=Gluconacetobacter azotocaptans TaxID=142834 RepID=A0A7W4PEW2_9PROT|nr:NUDIX domain-containing protein [Gluconacetobacter azotocaptans]MBB2191203.1 NUDIX domain-containing protein [Gluconacetobacter azotocaptans]GBQ36501.1 thiamin pyrophosphokinase [Gluconacetobacter azotocaptans DSM 13594]